MNIVSLFSGIGAFEEGARKAGINIKGIGYSELDNGYGKDLQKVYHALHGNKANYLGEVQDVKNLKEIDIITHGSPCQDFSQAGLMQGGDKGSGTQSSLMWETVRIVKETTPKVVIWENVKGVYFKNNIDNFNSYLSEMENLGYTNHHDTFIGTDYGVPQKRERMFCVSILGGNEYHLPEVLTTETPKLDSILEKQVDSKYEVPREMIKNWYHKKPPFGDRFTLLKYGDTGYTLVAKGGRAVITNNYILVNKGDYNHIAEYKGKPSLKEILEKNIPLRALTPREYWRMQGWEEHRIDKAFSQGISDARLYKMAGNSLVVPIAEHIFKSLKEYEIIE